MSKTFKSAVSERKLTIDGAYGNVTFTIIQPDGTESGLDTPSDSAAAQALAILEAAGVEACHRDYESYDDGSPAHLQAVMYFLKQYNEAQAERAAAEADRVALEAEALKLYNAGRKHQCMVNDATWDDLNNTTQKYWLAVARAARELNKEAGQ